MVNMAKKQSNTPALKRKPSLLRQRSMNPAAETSSRNAKRCMFTVSVLVCAFLASASDGGYGGYDQTLPLAATPNSAAGTPVSRKGSMSFNVEEKVKLMSSEGDIFVVDVKKIMRPDGIKCQSELINTMIEDSGTDEEIPLPNVKTSALKKIIQYMDHHHDKTAEEIQKPLKSTVLKECGVSEWDADYVSIEQEELFELILAANFLDIKELLDLTCAKVASMIKGKNSEEIRKQFNIVNDFTPEEEAQVREENRWCEDQ